MAQVMMRSMVPRTSLARVTVVLMRSLVNNATARFFFMALVWLASVPSLRPFL